MSQPFMSPGDHFNALLAALPEGQRNLYRALKHVRAEACFRGRAFVLYRMKDGHPEELDQLTVVDFESDDDAGSSTLLQIRSTGERLTVGYSPVQVQDYRIFVHLPLHAKLRWSTVPSRPHQGSMAFDLVLRTQSRLTLRERGVVYCETSTAFGQEFNLAAA